MPIGELDPELQVAPPRVVLRGIEKTFPGVRALKCVDLHVRAGEIHALCGENGAGKSTLIGVLGGVVRPDAGEILLDGQPLALRSPADALARGVATIHQELRLVGTLSVAENLAIGDEPHAGPWINRSALRRRAQEQLEALGFPLDPAARCSTLTAGQQQLAEIARALGRQARVLVLDEPTAALARAEVERLFRVLRDLRARGLAIIYISHHLDEVFALADRITVLRDGARVGTWGRGAIDPEGLIAAMVGEAVDVRAAGAPSRRIAEAPLLRIENAENSLLRGASVEVHAGEIVGLTGLAGAGHEEFGRVVFGLARLASGRLEWLGRSFRPRHPAQARAAGIAFVPPDRRREGLVPALGLESNLTLAILARLARFGWLNRRLRRRKAHELARAFEITFSHLSQRPTTLSGGNQQKLLLARWAATEPRLLILNEPTRGIDVRTREAIHRRIEAMAAAGLAILLITADTQELLRLADRILVFRAGQVTRALQGTLADEHELVTAMTGT